MGDCARIWRTYLKHCDQLDSILPAQLSLAEVWRLVQGLSRQHGTAAVDTGEGRLSFSNVTTLFNAFCLY